MSPKAKMALAGALVALLGLGVWWGSLTAKLAASAQAQLVAKAGESVNGTVAVGGIDFSIFGTLTVHGVTVSDRSGAVAGRSERVALRFGLGDVLAGRADLSAVKSVTLENAVVTLASGQDGRWNWESLLKPDDREVGFRGAVTVKNGTVLVREVGGERRLEAVNGSVDFARYPALGFDLAGKSGATPLAVKGTWARGGDGEVAVKADQASLADVPLGLLGLDLRPSGGLARNVTVTVKQQAGRLSLTAEGAVEKLAASVAGYALSEGAGKLVMADGRILLRESSVLVNGQKVMADGAVTPAETGLALSLDMAAAAFDPGALAATPLAGPVAFKARLEGTPDAPRARGTFAIPRGSFGAITFVDGAGSFTYGGGTLTLADTRASAWDGTLTVEGDIALASQQYRLTARGSGVDSAQLTDKDIKGRVNFTARLSGQGATGGYAEGSFQMGEGSFSGIPFLSMTGDFVKRGEQMSFQNVVVNTVGGSFRAEGFSEGSIVRLRQTGGAASPREALEKAITDRVVPDLKKLLPGR